MNRLSLRISGAAIASGLATASAFAQEQAAPVIGKARAGELARAILSLDNLPSLAAILTLSEAP